MTASERICYVGQCVYIMTTFSSCYSTLS